MATEPPILLDQRQVMELTGWGYRWTKKFFADHRDVIQFATGVQCHAGRKPLLPLTALPERFQEAWRRAQGAPEAEDHEVYLAWKATLPDGTARIVEERRQLLDDWKSALAKNTAPDGRRILKTGEIMKTFAAERQTTPASIYRLIERARRDGFFALAPGWGKRRERGKLDARDRGFLKGLYSIRKQSGLRPAAIYQIYKQLCEREGRPCVSENTVRTYLRTPDCRQARDLAHLGAKKFLEKWGLWIMRLAPGQPGWAYVSDHRQIDVAVVWDDGRILFPWVTAWMDEATFHLVGWTIVDVPNSTSIQEALGNAILHFGIPTHILTDNGKDYLHLMLNAAGRVVKRRRLWDDPEGRELLSTVYAHLGIKGRHLAKPRHPQSKRIERFFAFLSARLDPALIGWRGRNTASRPDAVDPLILKTKAAIAAGKPVGLAHGTCMTRAEFEGLVGEFFLANFDRETSAGRMKGRTPRQAWEAGGEALRKVTRAELHFLFMRRETRTVHKGGIVQIKVGSETLYWRHEALVDWKNRKVEVRYDAGDLAVVYVCDPEHGGALICTAELVKPVPFYEEDEGRPLTRAALDEQGRVNKRLVRAARSLGEAEEEARRLVMGLSPNDFFGLPPAGALPDLSHRPIEPIATGFRAAAKAASGAAEGAATRRRAAPAARRTLRDAKNEFLALSAPTSPKPLGVPEADRPLWMDFPMPTTTTHEEDE